MDSRKNPKKLWVKQINISGTISSTSWGTLGSDAYFTPEEDITVVGFQLHQDACSFTTAEGIAMNYLTLYKGVMADENNCLARCELVEEYWEVVTQCVGRQLWKPSVEIFYPADTGISIVEGDNMLLTTWCQTTSGSHTLQVSCQAFIYYRRIGAIKD